MPSSVAIADEVVVLLAGLPTTLLAFTSTPITASGNPQAVTPIGPTGMTGIATGVQLLVDAANPEQVVVTATTSTTWSAVFTKNHSQIWSIGLPPFLYSSGFAKLGEIQDPTNSAAYASVTFARGRTKHFDSGFRINDYPALQIESGFALTNSTSTLNSTTAETQLLQARDVLIPFFIAQLSLQQTPGVYVVFLGENNVGTDKGMYKRYPNGLVYRIHLMEVMAVQQYNVQLIF